MSQGERMFPLDSIVPTGLLGVSAMEDVWNPGRTRVWQARNLMSSVEEGRIAEP